VIQVCRDRSWASPFAGMRGFTLLELSLVLALAGLLLTLILPRVGLIGSAALDSSTRQLSARLRFLREEAARRGTWVRVVFDPAERSYQAEILTQTTSGPQFVSDPSPLYRRVHLPQSIGLDIAGPGRTATGDGRPAAILHPDGFADPVVIYLDDGAGREQSIVVDPTSFRPVIFDRHVEVGDIGDLARDLGRP
jgi:prepilin-type N-terminal cleavage/methylation domain-containing protein